MDQNTNPTSSRSNINYDFEMRLGIIADVHGNLLALEAVLRNLRDLSVDAIYDLGDTVFGSLEPRGSLELLQAENILCVRGNTDRILVDTPENLIAEASLEFVKTSLRAAQLEYLDSLPKTREVNGILLVHATPLDDEICLLERINTSGVFLEEDHTIATKLGDVPNQVIFCGHSHVARTVLLSDGRLVVNPGSVGQPAYQHDKPVPHVMQSGSPHARCAVLTQAKNAWNIQQLMVVYDWEAAARQAEFNGRPDRAGCLRTGRASLQDA